MFDVEFDKGGRTGEISIEKLPAFCHLRTFWGFDCLAVKGNNLETRAENAAPSWGAYDFTNSILAAWEWLEPALKATYPKWTAMNS